LLLQGFCQAAREAWDAGSQPGDAHQHKTQSYYPPSPLQAAEHARISRLLLMYTQKRIFQKLSIQEFFMMKT
jgi:hypothetical protein